MRKTIRKSSKITKKGILEKIYKEYTLPIVFEKNGGLCVCCNKNRADGGHHIFGREKDYYHIRQDFVVPVCNWCHSKEKSTNPREREVFKDQTEQYFLGNFQELSEMAHDFLGAENKIELQEAEQELNNWVWTALTKYGYKPR